MLLGVLSKHLQYFHLNMLAISEWKIGQADDHEYD